MLRQGKREFSKGDIYHQGDRWRLLNLSSEDTRDVCGTTSVGQGNEICDGCEEVDAKTAYNTFPEEDLQSLEVSTKCSGGRLEGTKPGSKKPKWEPTRINSTQCKLIQQMFETYVYSPPFLLKIEFNGLKTKMLSISTQLIKNLLFQIIFG